MSVQDVNLTVDTVGVNEEEYYSIPLDISDIISICKEYNKLGHQIQNQIDTILENGIDQTIKNGCIKIESLPYIKMFLKQIIKNPYFGDAATQAEDCLFLIDIYCENNEKHNIDVN